MIFSDVSVNLVAFFTSLCPTIVVNISIVLVYLYVRRAVFYLT